MSSSGTAGSSPRRSLRSSARTAANDYAILLDSSSIAKRYQREPGTDWVQSICEPRTRPPIYLSQIATVEVVAAIRRSGRLHGLHPTSMDALVRQFQRHHEARRPQYTLAALTPGVMAVAAELCNRYWDVDPHPLRSLDAIQLASAKATASTLTDELIFVVSDTRLAAIAAIEGFPIVDPAHPPARPS